MGLIYEKHIRKFQTGGLLDGIKEGIYRTLNKFNPYGTRYKDYSSKSFDDAYKLAKTNNEDEFLWKGRRYNTMYKGPINEELKAYGIGDPKKDFWIEVEKYDMGHSANPPGHIAIANYDKKYGIVNRIDYGEAGNNDEFNPIFDNLERDRNEKYLVKVPFRDYFNVYKKADSLYNDYNDDGSSNYNLLTNNCADKVCEGLGIEKNPGITLPYVTLKKILKKYPHIRVDNRMKYEKEGELFLDYVSSLKRFRNDSLNTVRKARDVYEDFLNEGEIRFDTKNSYATDEDYQKALRENREKIEKNKHNIYSMKKRGGILYR